MTSEMPDYDNCLTLFQKKAWARGMAEKSAIVAMFLKIQEQSLEKSSEATISEILANPDMQNAALGALAGGALGAYTNPLGNLGLSALAGAGIGGVGGYGVSRLFARPPEAYNEKKPSTADVMWRSARMAHRGAVTENAANKLRQALLIPDAIPEEQLAALKAYSPNTEEEILKARAEYMDALKENRPSRPAAAGKITSLVTVQDPPTDPLRIAHTRYRDSLMDALGGFAPEKLDPLRQQGYINYVNRATTEGRGALDYETWEKKFFDAVSPAAKALRPFVDLSSDDAESIKQRLIAPRNYATALNHPASQESVQALSKALGRPAADPDYLASRPADVRDRLSSYYWPSDTDRTLLRLAQEATTPKLSGHAARAPSAEVQQLMHLLASGPMRPTPSPLPLGDYLKYLNTP